MKNFSFKSQLSYYQFYSLIFGISLFILGSILLISIFTKVASAYHDENISILTNDLLQEATKYNKSQGKEKDEIKLRLGTIVSERKETLLEEIEHDPISFLLYALPSEVRDQLPPGIREQIEEHVEIEGILTIIRGDDFVNKKSLVTYYLQDINDPSITYTLHFAKNPPALNSDSWIIAKGVKLDKKLVLANGNEPNVNTIEAAAAAQTGVQNTLVMIANFTNSNVPCSFSTVDSVMFTGTQNIDQYYQENSFNNISFVGVVKGPYPINYSNDSSTNSCDDLYGFANAADQKASQDGVNLSNYPRRIYVLPDHLDCGIGYGTLGGNPSRSWVFGNWCDNEDVYGHELGHNLGPHHSNTPSEEYADVSDIMGYAGYGYRHFNSPHKIEVGWVPSSRIQTVTTNGNYIISRLEDGINPGEPQVLKIFKPDTNEYYYIGYRRPIGYDSNLVTQYRDRTNVHRWGGVGGTFTYFLSALSDGQSYTDQTNGITITQTSHDTSRSYVSVSFSGPECVKANPTVVTISPISQSGTPGSTKNYTVTVNNNNSSVCLQNQYNLSGLVPGGWSTSFSPSVLNLNSGQQGSSTWSVTSSSIAVASSYQITAQAVDAVNSTYTDSENATYVVFIDTTPPTVSITNPINGTTVSGTVNIQVSASDSLSGVNRVEIYIDGSLKKTDTAAPYDYSWNSRKAANGTHTITAKGYDQQGNFSQPSITVTKVKR